MARVALLCRDLLFGSKLQGALGAAGHEVLPPETEDADLLVVDLTDPELGGIEKGGTSALPTLGFYSHVDQDTRKLAEEAGFTRIVPRSRMAREAAALVEGMVAKA